MAARPKPWAPGLTISPAARKLLASCFLPLPQFLTRPTIQSREAVARERVRSLLLAVAAVNCEFSGLDLPSAAPKGVMLIVVSLPDLCARFQKPRPAGLCVPLC